VHMETIELLPRHGIDDTKDCFFGIKMPRQIHVDTTVFELWFVGNPHWGVVGIDLFIGVRVEELVE
jgi:hypothetical protein